MLGPHLLGGGLGASGGLFGGLLERFLSLGLGLGIQEREHAIERGREARVQHVDLGDLTWRHSSLRDPAPAVDRGPGVRMPFVDHRIARLLHLFEGRVARDTKLPEHLVGVVHLAVDQELMFLQLRIDGFLLGQLGLELVGHGAHLFLTRRVHALAERNRQEHPTAFEHLAGDRGGPFIVLERVSTVEEDELATGVDRKGIHAHNLTSTTDLVDRHEGDRQDHHLLDSRQRDIHVLAQITRIQREGDGPTALVPLAIAVDLAVQDHHELVAGRAVAHRTRLDQGLVRIIEMRIDDLVRGVADHAVVDTRQVLHFIRHGLGLLSWRAIIREDDLGDLDVLARLEPGEVQGDADGLEVRDHPFGDHVLEFALLLAHTRLSIALVAGLVALGVLVRSTFRSHHDYTLHDVWKKNCLLGQNRHQSDGAQ